MTIDDLSPAALKIGVLGPVIAGDGAGGWAPLAPLERAVLACLAIHAGRAVAVDDLIAALWGEDDEPATAPKTVQVVVSRTRRATGAAGARAIETVGGGYRLASGAFELDAADFEARLATARRLAAQGDAAGAIDMLDSALALWRGSALMDVRTRPFAVREADRLDELRQLASTDLAEAMVRIGRAGEAVEGLTALRRDRPLDERVAALLMRALYAMGRQSDSLAVYHATRTALGEELGVDPGPELEEAQRLVLAQDLGLRGPSPSPASPGGPTSVPALLSRTIGRSGELARLEQAFEDHRLITLTGPGGVGKTRLAIEIATRTAARFRDGSHFVDLAAVRDAALLPDAIAESLAIELEPGQAAEAAIRDRLARTRMLVVLDNLEQIPDGAAFIARLLASAPDVHVLATSRTPLWIRGELEVVLDPLRLPEPSATSLEEIRANPAVELLLDQAAHHGAVTLGADNVGVVVDVCRRLDGLPLAIELVAARLRSLSIEAVQAQLAGRLDVRALQVDLPDRQRTLRDTIGWSVGLLSAPGASLFRRLGVLVGGFPLPAVHALAAVQPPVADPAEALDELVRHSLVRAGERYTMLETIREYAADALAASGEGDAVRAAAVGWLTGVLADAEARFARAEDQAAALASADAERANVRDLLAWAAGSGRQEAALRLAAHRHFWAMHGSVAEARGWLERLMAGNTGFSDEAVAQGRTVLASILLRTGDLAGARREWEEASRLWQVLGEPRKAAVVENNLGIAAERQDDLEAARRHGLRALEQMRLLDDRPGIAATLGNLGVLALRQGDLDAGRQYNEEALAIGRQTGNLEFTSIALTNLAGIAVRRGRLDDARPLLREAFELTRRLDDVEGTITCLETYAELALEAGDPARAVRLSGAVERSRIDADSVPSAWEAAQAAAVRDRCREALGEAAYERELAIGRGMPADAVTEEALAV